MRCESSAQLAWCFLPESSSPVQSPSFSPAHPSTVATVGDGAKHHLQDGAVGGLGGSISEAWFTAFYREHQAPLFRTLRRWLFSAHDAEEVANDTFRRFYRALPKFRGDCSHRTFLYKIGVNLAHARYARNTRRRYYTNLSIDADEAQDHAAEFTDPNGGEFEREIRAGLGRLTESDRMMIELVADEDVSYEELSASMRIPIGTVKSRLARARTKLRRVMEVAA